MVSKIGNVWKNIKEWFPWITFFFLFLGGAALVVYSLTLTGMSIGYLLGDISGHHLLRLYDPIEYFIVVISAIFFGLLLTLTILFVAVLIQLYRTSPRNERKTRPYEMIVFSMILMTFYIIIYYQSDLRATSNCIWVIFFLPLFSISLVYPLTRIVGLNQKDTNDICDGIMAFILMFFPLFAIIGFLSSFLSEYDPYIIVALFSLGILSGAFVCITWFEKKYSLEQDVSDDNGVPRMKMLAIPTKVSEAHKDDKDRENT